jgi:hypothetical protein
MLDILSPVQAVVQLVHVSIPAHGTQNSILFASFHQSVAAFEDLNQFDSTQELISYC